MSWIAEPGFVPTFTIGEIVTYPTRLKVRGIYESNEFSGLPMIACEYMSDSPALKEPLFSGSRIIVPFNGETFTEELNIDTDFSVSAIWEGEEGHYLYRLDALGDQLLKSSVSQQYYLKYATGFTEYVEGYKKMESVDFVVIAQGIEDYLGSQQ